jgi:outer membrane protein OmpA-like peptidoglycan-associated protein
MKIVTYLLAALLCAALGAAALFYFSTFQPMAADYARMKAGMPELDKAKAELKKYKEKEAKEAGEAAWINPVVESLSTGLSDEIKTGKAEVTVAGRRVVVNVSEQTLYTPRSVTFAKDSPQLRLKIATLLRSKELKGKEIIIGNTTDPVPAQGRGKKKIPPKDARTLSLERSVALTKYLEQTGADQDALIAAAYASKLPDTGFKIKDHKTIIIIENPPLLTAPKQEAAPGTQPKSAPAEKSGTPPAAGAQQSQPKAIPIKPAQPKTN